MANKHQYDAGPPQKKRPLMWWLSEFWAKRTGPPLTPEPLETRSHVLSLRQDYTDEMLRDLRSLPTEGMSRMTRALTTEGMSHASRTLIRSGDWEPPKYADGSPGQRLTCHEFMFRAESNDTRVTKAIDELQSIAAKIERRQTLTPDDADVLLSTASLLKQMTHNQKTGVPSDAD